MWTPLLGWHLLLCYTAVSPSVLDWCGYSTDWCYCTITIYSLCLFVTLGTPPCLWQHHQAVFWSCCNQLTRCVWHCYCGKPNYFLWPHIYTVIKNQSHYCTHVLTLLYYILYYGNAIMFTVYGISFFSLGFITGTMLLLGLSCPLSPPPLTLYYKWWRCNNAWLLR